MLQNISKIKLLALLIPIFINPAIVGAQTLTANAGPDLTITAPASSIRVTGASATANKNYFWAGSGRPSGANNPMITDGLTLTPTFSGLTTPGKYTFYFGATDSITGNTVADYMDVTVVGAQTQSCTLPWGGTLISGSSTNAYLSSSVISPAVCTSQIRTCTNGVLSGSYAHNACTVTQQSTTLTANAGPDLTITAPASSIRVTGASATANKNYFWAGSGRPSGANNPMITDGLTLTPTFSGLTTPGKYTFYFGATDSITGNTVADYMDVTVVGAQQTIMCTLDAFICPDGSSVGRIAPTCQFAPCSTEINESEDEENTNDNVIDSEPDSIEELQEKIQTLQKLVATLLAQIAQKSLLSNKTYTDTDTHYQFTHNLSFGSKGTDVIELQKILKSRGYFTEEITGNFYSRTLEAVKKIQGSNGIEETGYVGIKTRTLLNSF